MGIPEFSRRLTRALSGQRTERVFRGRIWRRRPVLFAIVLLLGGASLFDHLRDGGGDDLGRYHNQVFRCVHVADGDTLVIDAPDGRERQTRIRLLGVDAPELTSEDRHEAFYADQAKQFARRTLLDQQVRVELIPPETRDRYGRLLAYVYVPDTGAPFNELLIAEGLAEVYRRAEHPRKEAFAAEQRRARQAKRGMWGPRQ